MKYLIVILLALSFNANSQTGSLICQVYFDDYEPSENLTVLLTAGQDFMYFYNVQDGDTLTGIEQGEYQVTFYCCDSSFMYKQPISIDGNAINTLYYNGYVTMHSDRPRNDTTSYHYEDERVFVNGGMQFGRGIRELEDPSHVQQNYQIGVFGGVDFLLKKSPFGMGYTMGFEYNRIILDKIDFIDPTIYHQRQRMTYFNFSASYFATIYIHHKKIMDFGLSYHIPLRAKVVQVNGNQKTYNKNIHNFNDLRLFAQVGFMWGFVFAEYRTVQFIKAPFDDLPKLNIGMRFNFPSSIYN
jgi:hypothetical protein